MGAEAKPNEDDFMTRTSLRATILMAIPTMGLTVAAMHADARTLQEALAITYASNPALQAQRALQRATDENVPAALAGWRPTVSVTANAGYADGATISHANGKDTVNGGIANAGNRGTNSETLTVSQPLYRGGATRAGTNKAENQVMSQRATLLAAEQTAFQNAVNAYVQVIQAGRTLELNTNNEQVLSRQLQATQDRFRVGEITRTDVAQAEAALAGAKAQRQTAQGNLETARSAYRQVVGELGWDSGEVGVPAVSVPAGVARLRTQILRAAQAEPALSAGMAQPRDADPIADRETVGAGAQSDDFADDLVPRRHPGPVHCQISLGDVQIGPAHPARQYRDEQFTGRGMRHPGFGVPIQRAGTHRTGAANPPCAHRGGHGSIVALPDSVQRRPTGPALNDGARRRSGLGAAADLADHPQQDARSEDRGEQREEEPATGGIDEEAEQETADQGADHPDDDVHQQAVSAAADEFAGNPAG